MNKEQFYKQLEITLRLIKEVEEITRTEPATETRTERRQLIDYFMYKFFELYLALRNDPSLKLNSKYKDFIIESQYFLRGLGSEIDRYIGEIEDRLRTTFYSNEWKEIICPSRSAIEAVKEIYRGTSFEERYEGDDPESLFLDTEDLDDDLESFSHKEGYLKEEDIPREIPASHWWWWSPNEPPNYIREDDE